MDETPFDPDQMAADWTVRLDADITPFRTRLGEADRLARGFSRTLTDGFARAVLTGRDLDDVLRGMALRLSSLALDAAFRPVENGLSSLFQQILGAAGASAGSSAPAGGAGGTGVPNLMPFAEGGVVGSPTLFPLGQGRMGLMGEAGPEAILPLSRGPDGRLGVAARGGGGAVTVTVNVATPDVKGFARAETEIAAAVARAVERGRRGR